MQQQESSCGCIHYRRYCAIQAPCCKEWYICKHCHDRVTQNPESQCQVERVEASAVQKIKCLECYKDQEPSQYCVQCKRCFGSYYCEKCRLWEDDPLKKIYHCDKCGICVIGLREEKFHCDTCNICLSIRKKNNHKCLRNALEGSCPICIEEMKHSGKVCVYFRTCGHWIHQECWDKYRSQETQANKCPICNKTLVFQTAREIQNLDSRALVVRQMMEELPPQIRERKIDIICNQCEKKSYQQLFNLLGHKCEHCGCYNTRQI